MLSAFFSNMTLFHIGIIILLGILALLICWFFFCYFSRSDMSRFVKKHSDVFKKKRQNILNRCEDWEKFKNNCLLDDFVARCNKSDICSNYANMYKQCGDDVITLYFGGVPLGMYKSYEKGDVKGINETDAALTFSRFVDGSVICFIWFPKSERKKPKRKYIIYGAYVSAKKLTDYKIKRILSMFLVCTRCNSAVLGYTFIDKIRYCWLMIIRTPYVHYVSLRNFGELKNSVLTRNLFKIVISLCSGAN